MGRYVTGMGFEFKYIFGEQPNNLAWLAGRSGVGTGSMTFDYFFEDEDGDEAQLGAGDKEVKGLGPWTDGSFVVELPAAGGFTEETPHGVVGTAIEIVSKRRLRALRRALPGAPAARMEVSADYDIASRDYPALLAWITQFFKRSETLSLEGLGSASEDALYALFDVSKLQRAEYLPFLALSMLAYAVKEKLTKMSVHDDAGWSYDLWPRPDETEPEPDKQQRAGKKSGKKKKSTKNKTPKRKAIKKGVATKTAKRKPAKRKAAARRATQRKTTRA